MYGCPYGLLYSSTQTVRELQEQPNFRYMPGFVVQRVNENHSSVEVIATRPDGTTEALSGDRVFLGAGVLATTAIVLRSLNLYDEPVTFHDSHYFMMPMLRLTGAPAFERKNLQTMSQIFIEIMDEKLSPFATHLQVYTYSDLFEQPIRKMLGPLARIFPWNSFLSRMILVQGFLHSNDSPGFIGQLERVGDSDQLRLTAKKRPETNIFLKKLMKKLWSFGALTGAWPVPAMNQEGEPGRSFHTGGTFPMALHPKGLESDLQGRPPGLTRTHVVDASVLPSIAGTTITYTVMANAHRIGTLAGSE
jgi:GMC oxidoreductase